MLYSPKWSKAKRQLKSFTCQSLRSRVDFQVINYRRAHDQLGRAVITVDKVEKLNMCTITADLDGSDGWSIDWQFGERTFHDHITVQALGSDYSMQTSETLNIHSNEETELE